MGTLQDEIKQSRPFRSPSQEVAIGLMRTADRVRRTFASVIEPFGITLQQYNVLRILRGAGDDPLPTLELARRMIEETPGITRLLDRLESKTLVSRTRCPRDRRQVLCSITQTGLELLARLDTPMDQADEAALSGLEVAEQRRLIALLDRVRAGLPGSGA